MRMFNLLVPEHLQAVAANALVWAFQQAHREETDQQRHGCRQAVALEWAATIRRKSHEVRDIAAGEQIGNHLDARQTKAWCRCSSAGSTSRSSP